MFRSVYFCYLFLISSVRSIPFLFNCAHLCVKSRQIGSVQTRDGKSEYRHSRLVFGKNIS